MNNNFAFDLNILELIVFAIIAIIVIMLMFNNKLNVYLKRHFILDSLFNSLLWLSLWFIGNEFIKWWISGGIALFISIFIEKVAKKH